MAAVLSSRSNLCVPDAGDGTEQQQTNFQPQITCDAQTASPVQLFFLYTGGKAKVAVKLQCQ
jgi:hypothetical protein